MKKNILLSCLSLLFSSGLLQAGTDTTNCNWVSRVLYFDTWDTCKGVGYRNSVNAEIVFKTPSCYKYAWTVNGKLVGTNNIVNYLITRNGTYNFCLKVTDTCNQCDTTVCMTKTITCFPVCNWKAKSPLVKIKDSCNGMVGAVALYASVIINNASCVKYEWIVDGKVKGKGTKLTYPISGNGNYKICLKLTDTCNMCDTTICINKAVNCKPSCSTWRSRSNDPFFWHNDTCVQNKTLVRTSIWVNYQCLKYEWMINGVKVASGPQLNYYLPDNGFYNICLKVRDTCNQCDTSYCFTQYAACNKNACDWASKMPGLNVWDTCRGNGYRNSLNGSISFGNGSDSCYKYTWLVNGLVTGASASMDHAITKNGTYDVCVHISDTCNKCDTIICTSRSISCFTECNWKGRVPALVSWDSCNGKNNSSINASVSLSNQACLTYEWKVNGVIQSGNTGIISYPITKNGHYTICVKITDTCTRCDTTICLFKPVNCFGAGCHFDARVPYFSVWEDTCQAKKATILGYMNFDDRSCLSFQWEVGGKPAGNTNTLAYDVSQNGSYEVCVRVTDTCNLCDTVFCMTKVIDCRSLGIKGHGYWPAIKVYPNPAGELLNIVWPGETVTYEMINVFGSSIMKGELAEGMNLINIAGAGTGIYTIRICSGAEVRIVRLIVQQ